uniref:Ionotropic glutamate receptor L-glutamate and glycine-binding domain-containing protein n=1 Tax=Strigamia maritima TaxID=126957 RepID=T1JNE2_STRMM
MESGSVVRCALSLFKIQYQKRHFIEICYLGYKWLRIDNAKNSFLLLNCDNQSVSYAQIGYFLTIRNIQIDNESQCLPREMRISVVDFPLDTILTYRNKSLTVEVGGYFGQILNIFETQLNISLKLIASKTNQFGALINGSWIGMIDDLIQGKADIATGVSMTSQRGDYVRFSPTIYSKQFDIIYWKLDQFEWNFNFYFQPCKIELWLAIIAVSLIVVLLKVFESFILRQKPFESCFLNFIYELPLCWPIVLQGNLHSYSFKSTKLVFGIYIGFSMLVLIYYNSILTSLLAIPDTKIPFNSLDDMFDNTNYLPVILKGSNLEEIFLKSKYENMSVLRVDTLAGGIESVSRGKYGIIQSLQAVQYLIGNNCSFAVAPHYLKKEPVAFAYSKQFSHKEYFDSTILLLKQYGILSAEFKRVYSDQQKCSASSFNTVSFGQIIGLFTFIMSAIIISLIFGILELISVKVNLK